MQLTEKSVLIYQSIKFMNFGFNKISNKIAVLAVVLLTATVSVFPQNPNIKPPRQEKLLNGLKVLMWSEPTVQNVSVKIRFHSGSAFDPQDKEGLMQMLAENIFPNETVKEYFTEDLGGSLEILTNYDFIQINATAKSEAFLELFEALANAVANPTINKEITAKLKTKQLEKVKELEKNPAYVADQAAANRLLGTFPYGRKQAGTPESVQKIDFADLLLAKQRFLTSDNATVTISGNFKTDLAFRAARRFFGSWLKSDKLTPSTFRQPNEPDTKHFEVMIPFNGNSEVRHAMRGLARNDKDYAASKIFTKILQYRLQSSMSKNSANIFVRQSENILPGLIVIGFTPTPIPAVTSPSETIAIQVGNAGTKPKSLISLFISQPISQEEYSKARAEVLSDIAKKNYADWWLDVDTYKIASVAAEANIFDTVTQADVQRVADKLYKNPVVSVSLMQAGEATPKN